MSGPRDLRDEYERIRNLAPAERGRRLEPLLGLMFRRAHFAVKHNPGAARPRQTDLFVYNDRRHYLVEAKWEKEHAGIDDLDDLRSRLQRVPPDVIGVLVSLSGFSKTVLDEARLRRERPTLLVGPSEFESVVDGSNDMRRLLERKLDAMRLDGVVDLDEGEPGEHVARRESPLKAAPSFVLPNGQPATWIASRGSFGAFTFARSVTDPNWHPGPNTSVVLDVSLDVESQEDLLRTLDSLDELGRLSNKGQWCIQQTSTNWHGFGADGLRSALERWEERYRGADDLHYREEGCYADSLDDGFYTLTFDVSADQERRVWYAGVSLELTGLPLDPQPVQELCRTLGDPGPLHFRVRTEPVFSRLHLRRLDLGGLPPVASVVFNERWPDGEEQRWVGAVAIINPLANVRDLGSDTEVPPQLRESELLICDIGSWHHLEDGPRAYRLRGAEWAWTSDGVVLHVRADWDDPEFEQRRRPGFDRAPIGSTE